MAIALEDVIQRAGDRQARDLLGPAASRLIGLLEPGLIGTNRLRTLVLELHDPVALLTAEETWTLIVELLPFADAQDLAKILFGSPDDPYTALAGFRLGDAPSSTRDDVIRFFGIVPMEYAPLAPVAGFEQITPAYGLFEHQKRAAGEVVATLTDEPKRCVLHMPTGAGKTRTSMHIACEWLNASPHARVLWLAHSQELLNQAAGEFVRAWGHLGVRPLSIGRVWGSLPTANPPSSTAFTVAGLQKLWASYTHDRRHFDELTAGTTLIVFDEAHQSVARTYREMVEAVLRANPSCALLGLTATPGRTWDDPDADLVLADFFAQRKVGLQIPGYDDPVEYLVAEGYLAQPRFISLNYSSSEELSQRDRAQLSENFDIPDSVLQHLGEDEQRNLRIVEAVENLLERHDRVIVFAPSVEASDLLAAVLRARQHDAASVTGVSGTAHRNRAIDRYSGNGRSPMVLCNYGVLTAGFDAPRTSAVVVARPTRSLVLYSQMVGRGIRGRLQGGNDSAEIVTVVDPALRGFGSVSEAFSNWEDVW
jgi:DNA repair protein RadD